MKYLLLLIFILSSSFAQNSSDIINRQIKDLEEKKVFEQQKIYEQQKDGLNFKDELLNRDFTSMFPPISQISFHLFH